MVQGASPNHICIIKAVSQIALYKTYITSYAKTDRAKLFLRQDIPFISKQAHKHHYLVRGYTFYNLHF